MISNLIVFSTLILGALFTLLYMLSPQFRARVEQPKYTFLEQLSMYDKKAGAEQVTDPHRDSLRYRDDKDEVSSQDNITINSENNEQ